MHASCWLCCSENTNPYIYYGIQTFAACCNMRCVWIRDENRMGAIFCGYPICMRISYLIPLHTHITRCNCSAVFGWCARYGNAKRVRIMRFPERMRIFGNTHAAVVTWCRDQQHTLVMPLSLQLENCIVHFLPLQHFSTIYFDIIDARQWSYHLHIRVMFSSISPSYRHQFSWDLAPIAISDYYLDLN